MKLEAGVGGSLPGRQRRVRSPVSWRARLVRMALALSGGVFAAHVASCRKDTPEKPRLAAEDPNADGQRLAASSGQWLARWQALHSLPSCSALLTEESPRALCEAVMPQVDRLRSELTRTRDANAILPRLGEVALAAERATQALRDRGVAQLFEARPTSSGDTTARPGAGSARAAASPSTRVASGGSAITTNARPASVGKPSPSPSHLPDAMREHDNPVLDAIAEYRRVSTVALRQIATYLELGPLPVRERAFEEVRRLSEARSPWADLKNVIREAELLEPNSRLKERLKTLRTGAP